MEQQELPGILPGTKGDSILNDVYQHLMRGETLTTLDGLIKSKTVCLPKYVNVLRFKYKVSIKDRWITLSNRKRVKQYWIEEQSTHQ